ncbi:hypothetical protein BU23DRAFT_205729 [Bimuria novae-zelandiae CBS 107.79]|uniref:Uncharacterized protein n=1 Tax=Bimuria novae-zelandiae CBS 107.79 TaxID=1447943 RepID=A0A6A5VBL8_9PLEO|nr:hypothetical protein BU23DRAFT_205729 [Bimuria novae-zelandiae CBS 107.79]
MPPISQFPPARVFLKMPPGAKMQPSSGVRRPSITTSPTARSPTSSSLRSPTANQRVSSTAKFSTTTAIGREAETSAQSRSVHSYRRCAVKRLVSSLGMVPGCKRLGTLDCYAALTGDMNETDASSITYLPLLGTMEIVQRRWE